MEAVETLEDRPSKLRIYLIVMAVSTLNISTGAVVGWSSPVLPKLNLTSQEHGLVVSLYFFGAAPGPFITTLCLDTIGRKGTFYSIWFFYLVSWVTLLVSQEVYVIYVARFIAGLGIGGARTAIPCYIAEVATAEFRGRLGATTYLMIHLGTLIMLGFGPYVSYFTVSIIGMATVVLFALVAFFIPESPFHLVRERRMEDAEIALQKLRGYSTRKTLLEELEEIKKTVHHKDENAIGWLERLKHPAAFKAIWIGLFLASMIFSSGALAQVSYAETMYSSLGLSFSASYVGIVNVLAAIIFLFFPILLINKCFSVKTGIIISGLGCGLTCAFLAIYFYAVEAGCDLYDYSYLALVLSVANSVSHEIGVGTLIWSMVAELMPMSIKAIGIGVVGCFGSLVGFVILAVFPIIASSYGYSMDFFSLAIIMFILTTLTIFNLPDTSGKTLKEITELLT